VQRAEREIARGHVVHDDAEAEDVEHLRERQVLLAHLAVDRVEVLLAPVTCASTALSFSFFVSVQHLADDLAAVAAATFTAFASTR
jgi:hypothetical protein